ncbi:MAG: hypothetical protein P8181_07390 [bacterium]
MRPSAKTTEMERGQPAPRRANQPSSSKRAVAHYRRPKETPFKRNQRGDTTILFGNLTPKHEVLLRAVFERSGFRITSLPEPTKQSFRIGKEYCDNGLCNPLYYTAGALIDFLENLEAGGLTRDEIAERYVYLTLSDCGPCRFGMYESQYRRALENAGFGGFRVITTQLNKASRTGAKQSGLEFTLDEWFGLVNGMILGDLLYAITYRLRPYEVHPGDTDRAMNECIELIAGHIRNQRRFELADCRPRWLWSYVRRVPGLGEVLDVLGKFHHHYDAGDYWRVLEKCAARLDEVQVDRTRARPVVKVVGEFYSHLSESDANYRMFEFLEDEGAEVAVGAIAGVLQYWFFKSRLGLLGRRRVDMPPGLRWWQVGRRMRRWIDFYKRPLFYKLIDRLSSRQYDRINNTLGGLAPRLVRQKELARSAAPYYRPTTRGGEGHLEVAESIHCTKGRKCHMILSLKPFGCMPSTQSDGVMATVVSHHEEMLFASIETTGDSDINAYSRVQMVLSDAKRRASREFELALAQTGRSLEDIRDFISSHPELRRPSAPFRRSSGEACTAADYVLYVGAAMGHNEIWWRRLSCLVATHHGSFSSAWTSVPRRSKQ